MTYALYLWFVFTFFSLFFVVWDQWTNTPSVSVMKWAWALTIIYTGPVGLFFYLLSCRQPLPETHDAFIKVHWKQALGSEIHCVAGDATAIIGSAAFLHYYPLPNGLEAIVEYVAAYFFGLFIFQALFMMPMYPNYLSALRKTIFPETVSMNFVMAGMLPVVLLVKHYIVKASDPFAIEFWGMMSLATIIGFFFAYPINSYLVKKGYKHGMMTQKKNKKAHEHHQMSKEPTQKTIWFWVIISFAFLVAVFYLSSFFAPIEFWD